MADNQNPPGAATARGRPAELIKYCQNQLVKHLLAYVTPVFDNTVEALYEMSEKGVDLAERNRLMDTQRMLRNKKTQFTELLNEQLGYNFDRFLEGKDDPGSHGDGDGHDQLHGEMSLVEETELEETLAISDLVSKAEVRFTQSIYALNQRLAILRGGLPVKNDTNPCGPLKIGRALREATEILPVDVEFKVKLFHGFDRLLQKNLGTCYDEINAHLVEAGVLPNIRFEAPKKKRDKPPPKPAAGDAGDPAPDSAGEATPADDDGGADGGIDFFGRAVAASRGGGGAAARSGAGGAAQGGGGSSAPIGAPATSQGGEAAPGQGPGEASASAQAATSSGLRQLLSKVASSGRDSAPGGSVAAAPQIQSALASLQQQWASGSGTPTRLSAEDIRASLGEALGKDSETGEPLNLPERESHTIDIMGMLYEHIEQEKLLTQSVQSLLQKLQVPMIRVALQEDEFLDDTDHPARKFFNTVAEAGELWLEDDADASPTFKRMQTSIDHVLEEYEGDNEVFKELLSDLDKHIKVLSRKATLAEKRHVAAARGQEKLESAREQARRLIDTLVEKYKPPKFVESVLTQPWCDVLALTVLRHGDDSEEWKKALTVAKTLIFSVRDDLDEKVREKLRKRVGWLTKELTRGLGQVGYYEQDIEALMANLGACHRWSLAPPDQPEKPEQPKVLSEAIESPSVTPQAVEKPPPPPKPELSDQEKAMLAKIRQLPFGSWFEIKLEADSDWVKRKLSWYSPLTGRCLFVNNRGAVAEEISLHQLAKRMATGTARVFQPHNKPLIDRAMDAIFGRLKKLASRAAPA